MFVSGLYNTCGFGMSKLYSHEIIGHCWRAQCCHLDEIVYCLPAPVAPSVSEQPKLEHNACGNKFLKISLSFLAMIMNKNAVCSHTLE